MPRMRIPMTPCPISCHLDNPKPSEEELANTVFWPACLYKVSSTLYCRTRSLRGRVRPNPSLKLTRYGRRCKPGPRHLVNHREPGLQRPPPRAA